LGGHIEEGAVVFSSRTLSHTELVAPVRFARLAHERLVEFQDAYARSVTVRGLASTREFEGIRGATISEIAETGLTDPGPVRLAKVTLAGTSEEEENEITVAWGFRKTRD
jgi:hypothetical protein